MILRYSKGNKYIINMKEDKEQQSDQPPAAESFDKKMGEMQLSGSSDDQKHLVVKGTAKQAPWPTAIDPKFLQQTQIGTMIGTHQQLTIVDQLQNDRSAFQEFDMGQFDEDDKHFIIVDLQTKKIYDMRKENDLLKMQQDKTANLVSLDMTSQFAGGGVSGESVQANTEAVKEWWKKKRRNNQDLLLSAEYGDIKDVKRLLDKESALGDLIADVNAKGLDQWTPLHFAANEGKTEVVQFLLTQPEIDLEASSTIGRTPIHLASIRGHINIVRALVTKGANKNAKDFDENTPLHHASEFGHFEVIIFLIKEAFADASLKNKFGYSPSDIAQNIQIRDLFEKLMPSLKQPKEEEKSFYGRTAFAGVLRHNDRINSVQKLMRAHQDVYKMLQKSGPPEEQAATEQKKDVPTAGGEGKMQKMLEKHEKKWKQKFIKIWQFNEQLENKGIESVEQSVGPRNFMPIMKLGQGSFGQVFLCEKFTIKASGA